MPSNRSPDGACGIRATKKDLTFPKATLIRFDGNRFSLFFDASASGADAALDLDAAHYLPDSGRLLLSFDSSGVIAVNVFDDGDILQYDPLKADRSRYR